MQADAPRRLQPFRVEDRLHLSEAGVRILVDQHIIIFSPVADLARRALHPARDHLIAVRAPGAQPSPQLLHRRRQDEDADDVRSAERRVGKEWVSTCRYRWSSYD